jgi:Flp pilus assembly protein TadG
MIEYAIVLPVFLMLTLGIVDFSRAVWASNTLAFLARDGARYGSAPSHSTANIQSHITGAGGRCELMLSNPCAATATITRGSCGVLSSPVVVTVTYAFQPATLMIASLWGGGTLPLQARSQMYVEAGPVGGCAS